MRKKMILTFVLTLFLGIFEIAEAQTDRQMKLRVNELKAVPGSKISIKFISVLEDSRCPEDANCIWAGNAKLKIKLRKNKGVWKSFELNTNQSEKTISFEGFDISIADLDPKPRSNIRINRYGYTATFKVSKK